MNKEHVLALRHNLLRISQPIRELLSIVDIALSERQTFQLKSALESLLPIDRSMSIMEDGQLALQTELRDFCLCCAALASAESGTGSLLSKIPPVLCDEAKKAFQELSGIYVSCTDDKFEEELSEEARLVLEIIPDAFPLFKEAIKSSSIDAEANEIFAASARADVGFALLSSYEFRWLITKVHFPYLGKLCFSIIPCALTALDHWSPEVKGQAMVIFVHVVKNTDIELEGFTDAILDASCRNIPSDDEIWEYLVEMCVVLLTHTQGKNPRSAWFEKMLSEMLGHLERQPRNIERRVAWLKLIDPVLNTMGLVLLAHFRRIFTLFFLWMHADDDETVVLVLQRLLTVLTVTWIRKNSYIERLIGELTVLYKESAMRKDRDGIRAVIVSILSLVKRCFGTCFKAVWEKHKGDPNLAQLESSLERLDM